MEYGFHSSDRGVSPVIGVILMVAITVILAAVIGAFVLEIGDQQETAPRTSFDSEQATNFYVGCTGCKGDNTRNATEVVLTHAGGDVLGVSQTQVKVNGNASTWGVADPEDPSQDGVDCVRPRPNVFQTFGTNEQTGFSSGEKWNVYAKNGVNLELKPLKTGGGCASRPNHIANYGGPSDTITHKYCAPNCGGSWPPEGFITNMDVLEQGDGVNVVWTASSGGKTQTLFKYTVQ
jgi:flagellin-like protein